MDLRIPLQARSMARAFIINTAGLDECCALMCINILGYYRIFRHRALLVHFVGTSILLRNAALEFNGLAAGMNLSLSASSWLPYTVPETPFARQGEARIVVESQAEAAALRYR